MDQTTLDGMPEPAMLRLHAGDGQVLVTCGRSLLYRYDTGDQAMPEGLTLTQPWPAGATDARRDQVIYYQYSHDRARRTLKGIDEQVAKAEKAVAGKAPVKRNRFIRLVGASKSVNRDLEAKARALAGIKGYVTNLARLPRRHPRHVPSS